MKRVLIAAALLIAGAGLSAQAKPAAYTGAELAKSAKVTVDQAEATALSVRPGRVTDKELEKEAGGLRYSFDIVSGGKTYEVGIDAETGKVLENQAEGKNPD
jgi:uncharacterized membrane protein YkoI